MKSLLLVPCFFLCLITAKCQAVDPCSHNYRVIYTIGNGYNSLTGYTLTCEAGIWGMNKRLGGDIGVMLYTHHKLVTNDTGNSSPVASIIVDPYLRATFKLDRDLYGKESKFSHAITCFYSLKGNYGLCYRAYYTLADNIAIGMEPNYTLKNGPGANFLVTLAFN